MENIQLAGIKDFEKLDIRVGEIIDVKPFPEARKRAFKIKVNFGGDIGVKKTSAQLVDNYQAEDLMGKNVLAVVNFPVRQIGPFLSEVLILGVPDKNGKTILIVPELNVPPGGRLY